MRKVIMTILWLAELIIPLSLIAWGYCGDLPLVAGVIAAITVWVVLFGIWIAMGFPVGESDSVHTGL